MVSSNFLVWVLHTGVSSDGTTLKRRALAGVSARVTASRPRRHLKSGALPPALTSGPTRVTGPPLNLTAPARFVIGCSSHGEESGTGDSGRDAARESPLIAL